MAASRRYDARLPARQPSERCPTVLVTSAEQPTALYLLEALQQQSVTLLACGSDERAAGFSEVPDACRFVVSKSGSRELVADLLTLCTRLEVDWLMVTDPADVAAIARQRVVFERLGVQLWLEPARRTTRPITASDVEEVCRSNGKPLLKPALVR